MQFCTTLENTGCASGCLRSVSFNNKRWAQNTELLITHIGGDQAKHALFEEALKTWFYQGFGQRQVNLSFRIVPANVRSHIRVTWIPGGSWSSVGTDALNVSQSLPTMNIGTFTFDNILHELGHGIFALGHEHANPDPNNFIDWNLTNVYNDVMRTAGWTRELIKTNIIDRYDPRLVTSTGLDRLSIMAYSIPQSWTNNNFSIELNRQLSETDKSFVQQLYPIDSTNITTTQGSIITNVGDSGLFDSNRQAANFGGIALGLTAFSLALAGISRNRKNKNR